MGEADTPRPGRWPSARETIRASARRAAPFAGGVLAALAALLIYRALFPAPAPLTSQQVGDQIAQTLAEATPEPPRAALVYAAIQPALVLIQTERAGPDARGLGSGVVINADGLILTSLHVVAGASAITVTFADGTASPAAVVVEQPENDIAVLEAANLPVFLVPATLGNPDALQIGDEAFVVGHPLGLYGSLSAGVVSGLDRTFQPENSAQPLTGLIQVDAAINPGNSGGPLLNRDGQVIGIVAGLVNPTDQEVFIGLGFAVPIDVAGGAAGLPPY